MWNNLKYLQSCWYAGADYGYYTEIDSILPQTKREFCRRMFHVKHWLECQKSLTDCSALRGLRSAPVGAKRVPLARSAPQSCPKFVLHGAPGLRSAPVGAKRTSTGRPAPHYALILGRVNTPSLHRKQACVEGRAFDTVINNSIGLHVSRETRKLRYGKCTGGNNSKLFHVKHRTTPFLNLTSVV